MAIGALIIGDEILSGKRQDKHLPHLIESLRARGMELAWAEYLGDVPARILASLQRSMASEDIVFSFGGIGATPDDHTRRIAAQAAGLAYQRHPQALALIEAQFGDEAYPNRVRMADLPAGCGLIPNPVNRIPGFTVKQHHFVPGFPSMAWPMIDWVLDTLYPQLHFAQPKIERRLLVPHAREGNLIQTMEALVAQFPELRFSSLPSFGTDTLPPHIEFGLTGSDSSTAAAMDWLKNELSRLGYHFEDQPSR